jgi:flagellar P-ring protein precursor FlgI
VIGRLALVLFLALVCAVPALAGSRIKDITNLQGVRENQMVGYGLVVGLNGTGDSLRNSVFTEQSLQSMLDRLGVNTAGPCLQSLFLGA